MNDMKHEQFRSLLGKKEENDSFKQPETEKSREYAYAASSGSEVSDDNLIINIIFIANGIGITQRNYWDRWRDNDRNFCRFRVHQAEDYVPHEGWEKLPTKHAGHYWEERNIEMFLEIFAYLLANDKGTNMYVFVSGDTIPIRPYASMQQILRSSRDISIFPCEPPNIKDIGNLNMFCSAYSSNVPENAVSMDMMLSIHNILSGIGPWWILTATTMKSLLSFFSDTWKRLALDYAWASTCKQNYDSSSSFLTSPDEFYMQLAAYCQKKLMSCSVIMLSYRDPEVCANIPVKFGAGPILFRSLRDPNVSEYPTFFGNLDQAISLAAIHAQEKYINQLTPIIPVKDQKNIDYLNLFFRKVSSEASPSVIWIQNDYFAKRFDYDNVGLEPPQQVLEKLKKDPERCRVRQTMEDISNRMGELQSEGRKKKEALRLRLFEMVYDFLNLQQVLGRKILTYDNFHFISNIISHADSITLTYILTELKETIEKIEDRSSNISDEELANVSDNEDEIKMNEYTASVTVNDDTESDVELEEWQNYINFRKLPVSEKDIKNPPHIQRRSFEEYETEARQQADAVIKMMKEKTKELVISKSAPFTSLVG